MNLVQENSPQTEAGTELLAQPKRDEIELARVLHALSDPVRLQIVASIERGGECAMSAIQVPVTKSTCTHHFKVLREAGVLSQRQVGTARMNTLRRDDLDARFPGLLGTILDSVG
jgi:DNA-binding transcriptional ArsR family regulator